MVKTKRSSKKRAQIKEDPKVLFYLYKCRKCGHTFRSKDKDPICSICKSEDLFKRPYNQAG